MMDTPPICPVTNLVCAVSSEVREKQHNLDRLDNMERWVKLGGILATFVLVCLLLVAAAWQGGKIDTLTKSDRIQRCTLQALAGFAAGTGAAFDAPPAPNTQRSAAVDTILEAVPALKASARGQCVAQK